MMSFAIILGQIPSKAPRLVISALPTSRSQDLNDLAMPESNQNYTHFSFCLPRTTCLQCYQGSSFIIGEVWPDKLVIISQNYIVGPQWPTKLRGVTLPQPYKAHSRFSKTRGNLSSQSLYWWKRQHKKSMSSKDLWFALEPDFYCTNFTHTQKAT